MASELEQLLLERLNNIEDILKRIPLDETSDEKYGDFLLRWYQNYKLPNNSAKTSKDMLRYINDKIIPVLGDIPLNRLSGDRIQEFLNGIKKMNTRNKIALIVNGSLAKALKLHLIRYNPFDSVELNTYRKKHYRALSFLEQNIVIDNLNNRLYHAIFYILVCTGMRIGEFLALDETCVDRKDKYFNIYRDVDIDTGELQDHAKTYSSVRRIPYLADLDPYIDIVLEHGKITYNQVKQYFKKLYKRNGLTGLNLHSFRHTFGCIAYRLDIKEKTIQRLMGHANLDVTMNVYVDVLGAGSSPLISYFKRYKKDLENRPTDFWRFTPP